MVVWSKRSRRVASLVLAATITGIPNPSLARRPSREELEDRVRRLEEIIRRSGLDAPAPRAKVTSEAAAEAAEAIDKPGVEAIVEEKLRKQKVLAGWKDGFYLESPNGDFKLRLRGYAQADARVFPSSDTTTGSDSLFLRRVRPIFEGTVYKYFDFKIMPDFGQGQTALQDAYGRVNYWPYAQLTAGKFKSPLSLERLQSGAELTFIERSIANNLAPNRETGFALGGSALADRVSYMIGAFNGAVDAGNTDGDTSAEKDVQGRVFVEPFKGGDFPRAAQGLGFGVGGTFSDGVKEDYKSLAYKTAGRSNFFKLDTPSGTSVFFDGRRRRIAPQAYYYWGPFGFMGEYLTNETDLLRDVKPEKGPDVLTRGTFKSEGRFVQASYVLTGEDASYKQVVPINSFDPANGRWGAFEIAGRASAVDVNDGIFRKGFATTGSGGATRGAMAYTAGVNWYLNKNVKLQVNYERTDFDDAIDFGNGPVAAEDVFITRFQIGY